MSKLDIFKVLGQFDRRNGEPYEDSKELQTFIRYPALRWMSSSSNAKDHATLLEKTNRVNMYWWNVATTPEIQSALLASVGLGRPTAHKWIQPPKPQPAPAIFNQLREIYPGLSDDECHIYLIDLPDDAIMDIFRSAGRCEGKEQQTPIKEAIKSWRKKLQKSSSADTADQC